MHGYHCSFLLLTSSASATCRLLQGSYASADTGSYTSADTSSYTSADIGSYTSADIGSYTSADTGICVIIGTLHKLRK